MSVKFWFMLFVGSVAACWLAQELLSGVSAAVPDLLWIAFHVAFISVALVAYPIRYRRFE
jgi:hypothetical protein